MQNGSVGFMFDSAYGFLDVFHHCLIACALFSKRLSKFLVRDDALFDEQLGNCVRRDDAR